jgi:F-type H+-transporting ATPase subunit epsilon
MSIALHILSPEGTLVKAEVDSVSLPGSVSPFTVLKDHGAMVSALVAGNIVYRLEGREERLAIREGFVEIRDNVVSVCVEV